MRYWRCRVPRLLELIFWPVFGHLVRIDQARVYCERCPWTAPIPRRGLR